MIKKIVTTLKTNEIRIYVVSGIFILLSIFVMTVWGNRGDILLHIYYKYDNFDGMCEAIVRRSSPDYLVSEMMKDINISGQEYSGAELVAYKGEELIPVLVKKLKSPNAGTRYQAVRTLAFLKKNTPESYKGIITSLKDNNIMVRLAAIWALGEITYNTKDDLCMILKPFLKATYSPEERGAVFNLLYNRGSLVNVLSELLTLLKNADEFEKIIILGYLSKINSIPESIYSDLWDALESENAGLKVAVIEAFGSTGDTSLIPGLEAELDKPISLPVKQALKRNITKLRIVKEKEKSKGAWSKP